MAVPLIPRTSLGAGRSLAQAASNTDFPPGLAQMAHEKRMRSKYGYTAGAEGDEEGALGSGSAAPGTDHMDNRYKKKKTEKKPGLLMGILGN